MTVRRFIRFVSILSLLMSNGMDNIVDELEAPRIHTQISFHFLFKSWGSYGATTQSHPRFSLIRRLSMLPLASSYSIIWDWHATILTLLGDFNVIQIIKCDAINRSIGLRPSPLYCQHQYILFPHVQHLQNCFVCIFIVVPRICDGSFKTTYFTHVFCNGRTI